MGQPWTAVDKQVQLGPARSSQVQSVRSSNYHGCDIAGPGVSISRNGEPAISTTGQGNTGPAMSVRWASHGPAMDSCEHTGSVRSSQPRPASQVQPATSSHIQQWPAKASQVQPWPVMYRQGGPAMPNRSSHGPARSNQVQLGPAISSNGQPCQTRTSHGPARSSHIQQWPAKASQVQPWPVMDRQGAPAMPNQVQPGPVRSS